MLSLKGMRFGRLVVLDILPKRTGDRGRRWRTKCDCGNVADVIGFYLNKGDTKSCGCLRSDFHVTHGMARRGREHPNYWLWSQMKQRCDNPRHPNFAYYGGRGISVCERWISFENFTADMGLRPSSAHSIDRIDPDGNYEPGNCRWATKSEQSFNRRKRMLTVLGWTASIIEWAEVSGIDSATIRARLKYGWNESDAVLGRKWSRPGHYVTAP